MNIRTISVLKVYSNDFICLNRILFFAARKKEVASNKRIRRYRPRIPFSGVVSFYDSSKFMFFYFVFFDGIKHSN